MLYEQPLSKKVSLNRRQSVLSYGFHTVEPSHLLLKWSLSPTLCFESDLYDLTYRVYYLTGPSPQNVVVFGLV